MTNTLPLISNTGRRLFKNKKFNKNVIDKHFKNCNFLEVTAKNIKFINVDFSYTTFDDCYFRGCTFDSCNFTGVKFRKANMHGSKFSGSNFQYTTFERTEIDPYILETECPSTENLKMRFARSLRTNFAQLGDVESVNRAINIELLASEIHLLKIWSSNESYYRNKYCGVDRLKGFFNWLGFKSLDFIWGNGESWIKLVRMVFILLIGIALYDAFFVSKIEKICEILSVIYDSPLLFLGIRDDSSIYGSYFLASIYIIRMVMMAFFMSVIIKRINRR